MLCVLKKVTHFLRDSISSLDLSLSMSSWDKFDYRALGHVPRHRLNQSRFQRIRCLHSFVLVMRRLQVIRGWLELPVFLPKSHLEWHFPLPLRFKSHSAVFRVDVILNTEAFIVTGIVSSSLSWGSAVKTCEDVPERRMLLWATWSSRFACTSWRSITIRSPSPWGTGHDALVNRNSIKKKRAYRPSFLWSIYTWTLRLEEDKDRLEQ